MQLDTLRYKSIKLEILYNLFYFILVEDFLHDLKNTLQL